MRIADCFKNGLFVVRCSVFILLFIAGCKTNCDDEKSDVRSKYGAPEEINTYSSSGYSSETWWYWKKGVSFTFMTTPQKACEESKYTFSPVRSPSEAEKRKIKLRLINKKSENDCLTCP